jgi:TrmH family RNA methyltransferase
MLPITSPQNPKFRSALRLQSNRGRKDQDRILIFGEREICRAVQSGVDICEIFVCSENLHPEQLSVLRQITADSNAQVFDLPNSLFMKLAYGDRIDLAVAIARRPDTSLGRLVLTGTPFVLVVEAVEKPGNLGAIFRSADGAGVDAIIAANPLTDVFHPNSIQIGRAHV